jgi:hypothetical protein
MGMFDIILVEFRCPNCKKKSVFDMQTKDGMRMMDTYRLGDRFVFDPVRLDRKISLSELTKEKELVAWLLGSCMKCKCQMSGCAYINSSSFIIEEIRVFDYTISFEPKIVIKHKSKEAKK